MAAKEKKSLVIKYPRYGTDYPLDPLTHDELNGVVAILHESFPVVLCAPGSPTRLRF